MNPKDYTFHPIPRPAWTPPRRTVEDDMRVEIVRLRTEIATLKATLGMVRAVLSTTVANIGSVA
jgi:hypothetical protein